jgi:mono/diheme cytochrome c family protein
MRVAASMHRMAGACLSLAVLAVPVAASSGPPQQHYVLHCQGCHGPEGRGAEGVVSPLTGHMGRFLHVPGGRAYLVQVPGAAQAPLDDAELAALLNWMLEAFSPDEVPEDFAPFEPSEVARHRAERVADAAALRRELLAGLDGVRGTREPTPEP